MSGEAMEMLMPLLIYLEGKERNKRIGPEREAG